MKKPVVVLTMLLTGASLLQAQQKSLGMLFDDAAYKAVPMIEKPLGFGENLPSSASLKQYVPKIGNQGDMGTCVGWSSTYYLASMEYAILSKKTNRDEISTLVFDPLYTYNNIIPSGEGDYEKCVDGTYLDDAAEFLVKNDVKRKEIDQSSCGYTPTWDNNNSLLDFTDYYRLFDPYSDFDETVSSVCQSIVNNHPVLIGMNIPQTFFNVGEDGVFDSENSDDLAGGHALCVIGYDDNKMGGCFTIVNSWDNTWGDDGFVYVKYDDFFRYVGYGYSFETELRNVTDVTKGCMFGDCSYGYGVSKIKKSQGSFEGYHSDGKMGKGIYINTSKQKGKGGVKYIKKLAKKYAGTLVYDGYDYDNPIGFIKTY